MTSQDLIIAYRFHRFRAVGRTYPRTGKGPFANPAHEALKAAREDVANGTRRYPSHGSAWNPRWEGRGEKHMRWIESPRACGLRFVGYADSINSSIRHRGWFTDNDQRDTIRGVVFQMPARNGKPQFIAGYDNPDNGEADSDGPVALSFDVSEGERGDYWSCNAAENDGARTAANWADQLAEREAERERAYQSAWQAGNRFAELGEEIAEERKAALALLAERRTAARLAPSTFPALCATIRDSIRSSLAEIEEKRAERAKLRDGEYVAEWLPGFWSGDDDLRAAFAEGANF